MRIILLFFTLLVVGACSGGEQRTFTIMAENHDYLDCYVSVDLGRLYEEVPEDLALYMETEEGPEQIAFQSDYTMPGQTVTFIVSGKLEEGTSRQYYFARGGKKRETAKVAYPIRQSEDELVITDKTRDVLTYHISETMPPEGVEPLYKRSAYIHPLVSPEGAVLTRIQPPDHYHHYGIWNPWTKTHMNGREIDYWNLGKGEGTVRTRAILSSAEGAVYSAYTALQEHVDLGYEEGERVTMDEFWEVRFAGSGIGRKRYLIDLQSNIRNVTEDTILFDAYRYGGGLGYRATGSWNAENSSVLTSEGEERSTADGTRARWCIVEGETDTDAGRSGILFLSYPGNREHPEPMRVWPTDVHEGQLFFEFCPIRLREWLILPGTDHLLKYRMVVFDGVMTAEEAEMYWNSFAYGPEVRIDE